MKEKERQVRTFYWDISTIKGIFLIKKHWNGQRGKRKYEGNC